MQFKRFDKSESSSGKDIFLKFKDGESKTVVLRGEAYEFSVLWENGKSKTVVPGTPKSKDRFKINAVIHDGETFVMKILEYGPMLSNQFADIADIYDVSKTKIKITRRGTGLETEYSAMPIVGPKHEIAAKDMALIEALDLHVLNKNEAQKEDPPSHFDQTPDPEFEDIPF